jgi:hypothetical protein
MSLEQHTWINQMLTLLRRERISALYHFTDIDNLPLVARFGGLRSKKYLEEQGVLDQINTGGNQLSKSLDLHWGNWDKVSLSWCPQLPMAYWREQEQHLCYIVVNLRVALQQGVIFTDRNATDNDQRREDGLQGLQIVDFNAVKRGHPYPNQETKKRKQAEVLVPEQVPISRFTAIVFRSESSRLEASRVCGNSPALQNLFQVDDRLFILPSAYAKSHVLTTGAVTKDAVQDTHFRHQTTFSKAHGKVTLLLLVYVPYGTTETVKWLRRDGRLVREPTATTFASASDYWTWSSLNLQDLAIGQYFVDYYLSGRSVDIRQVRVPFLVTP